jgi:hypothetical protein
MVWPNVIGNLECMSGNAVVDTSIWVVCSVLLELSVSCNQVITFSETHALFPYKCCGAFTTFPYWFALLLPQFAVHSGTELDTSKFLEIVQQLHYFG